PVARALDVGDEPFDAGVVESQAIDERLRGHDSNVAGTRMAGWRARGNRSRFEKTETERREARQMLAVLVEAGRESDAVGKANAHNRDGRVCEHAASKE